MSLQEMLQEKGVQAKLDEMGYGAEKVLGKLTEETEAHYAKYEWFVGEHIVHAVPSKEMLEEGCPWEEWYQTPEGKREYHVLFVKKNEKCDMTFDATNLPADDAVHPEPVGGYIWYLYEDADASLQYTR